MKNAKQSFKLCKFAQVHSITCISCMFENHEKKSFSARVRNTDKSRYRIPSNSS